MPMFSSDIGNLIADLAMRQAKRQEDNADARARQTLLSYIQDPLYAQPAETPQAPPSAPLVTAPVASSAEFGFTPASGGTVTPMLTGIKPIIPVPGDVSQSGSQAEGGVSEAGRNKAEAILFPMLTKQENRDLSRKQAELDQLVRARPGLVSRMYAGEAGAKPIDDRIRELQIEIEKGQQANERLQTNQMLTGQRLVSSYSSRESQSARLAAMKEMSDARERTKRSIAAGRLDFDRRKLLVNSTLQGLEQTIRLYGIKSAYLSSPAALQRAVMTGTLDEELRQAGLDENTIGKTLGGIRRGVLRLQSQDPNDVNQGASELMDTQMDLEHLLAMGPAPEPNKWANLYNSIAPEGLQVQAVTPEQASEIQKANENLQATENTTIGTLKPGEAPPNFIFGPGGVRYMRVSEETGAIAPARPKPRIAPKAAPAAKKGWYKDPDGVMRKH